jgi:hypothetical protein
MSVGILFAWIAISCISLSLIQWFVRRKDPPTPPSSDSSSEESVAATAQERLKGGETVDRDLVGGA